MFSKEFKNGELTIPELSRLNSEMWSKNNSELFGVSAVSSDTPFVVDESLAKDIKSYWLEGTCKLKERILSKNLRCQDNLVRDSWAFKYNSISHLVALDAKFIFEAMGKRVSAAVVAEAVKALNEASEEEFAAAIRDMKFTHNDNDFLIVEETIAYIPLVTLNGYKIHNSEYVLRTQAYRNRFALKKIDGVVSQNGWKYDASKHEWNDGKSHFSEIHENYYPFLNAILGEQVTEDNIEEALDKMPEYNPNSILYFNFSHFDEVENTVLNYNRIINPKQGKLINYASLLNAPKKYTSNKLRDVCTNLVAVKNNISALEKSRWVIFAPSGEYSASFNFEDADRVFDPYKVTTNGLAGRIRVLLDNIYVEDGLLKITYGGKTYNHYDMVFGRLPKEIDPKYGTNLSCISRSCYNYLNDAKRIMLCAKLRGQSVPVKGQIDNFTNEVPARVVFGDWAGFSFGDSYIISESFAKKLEREAHKSIEAPKADLSSIEVGDEITTEFLSSIEKVDKFSNLRDIFVTKKTNSGFDFVGRAPIGIGDKITNMHGSKGVVSVILPDDMMPRLMNDLSDNMPAGPVDVIIPGVSVFRRKSTGQMFEAVTRALGIGEMPIKELMEKHGDEIKKFDEGSVFQFMGEKFSAPCGINHIIRLDHDSADKQSFSYLKTNYNFNLRFGEMELLNLASRGAYSILNELDIRSLNKHTDSYTKVANLQRTGIAPHEPMNSPHFKNFMRYLGWDFNDFAPITNEDVDERWNELIDLISNDELDIFDEYAKNVEENNTSK